MFQQSPLLKQHIRRVFLTCMRETWLWRRRYWTGLLRWRWRATSSWSPGLCSRPWSRRPSTSLSSSVSHWQVTSLKDTSYCLMFRQAKLPDLWPGHLWARKHRWRMRHVRHPDGQTEGSSAGQKVMSFLLNARNINQVFLNFNLKRYGIKTFPALVYFRNGNPLTFDGDLKSEESVLEWLVDDDNRLNFLMFFPNVIID